MADLKSIKKITKNINGQEVGLQVESAIRDGQGNVISDTYQEQLTAGNGITIKNNVISTTSGAMIEFGVDNQVQPSNLTVNGIFFEKQ